MDTNSTSSEVSLTCKEALTVCLLRGTVRIEDFHYILCRWLDCGEWIDTDKQELRIKFSPENCSKPSDFFRAWILTTEIVKHVTASEQERIMKWMSE